MTTYHVEFDVESNHEWYAFDENISALPGVLSLLGAEVWVPKGATVSVIKTPLPSGIYAKRAPAYSGLYNVYFKDGNGKWHQDIEDMWVELEKEPASSLEAELTTRNKLPENGA